MERATRDVVRLSQIGRVTTPRRAVLDAISAADTPFTIEELAGLVPGVGRATVFRTVKLLQESGAVCRMVLEDGSVRYQASQGDHHHHLICSECGRVEEFSDPALDARIEEDAARSGFHLDGHSLELYGRCHTCA